MGIRKCQYCVIWTQNCLKSHEFKKFSNDFIFKNSLKTIFIVKNTMNGIYIALIGRSQELGL